MGVTALQGRCEALRVANAALQQQQAAAAVPAAKAAAAQADSQVGGPGSNQGLKPTTYPLQQWTIAAGTCPAGVSALPGHNQAALRLPKAAHLSCLAQLHVRHS